MQHLQLDISPDHLPTDEDMRKLDVSDEDFGRFIQALKYSMYRAQGDNISAACRKVGMHRNTIYGEAWQAMLAKAQRLLVGGLTGNVVAANNMVFDRWPEMIQRLVDDAVNPLTPARDRADVIEFLYMSVIAPSAEEKRDDSAERIYLQSLNKAQFNPLQPINIVAQQVNIGAPDDPLTHVQRRGDDILDADLVVDADAAGNPDPEPHPRALPSGPAAAG